VARLPARIYWFRRFMVLAILALLIFTVARVVGSRDGSASPVSAPSTLGQQRALHAGPTSQPGAQHDHGKGSADPGDGQQTSAKTSTQTGDLPLPDGVCEPRQIQLTPVVADGLRVGQDIAIQIGLRTTGRAACSLSLTSDTMVVEVTTPQGDPVWTSDDCSTAIAPTTLVVRAAVATIVQVTWDGKRSDAHCSPSTVTSAAGDYMVRTAIIGGEPSESSFTLDAPLPTQTPSSPSPSSTPTASQSPNPSSGPSSGNSPAHT
jgi:hypothetical protein